MGENEQGLTEDTRKSASSPTTSREPSPRLRGKCVESALPRVKSFTGRTGGQDSRYTEGFSETVRNRQVWIVGGGDEMKDAGGVQETEGLPEVKWVPRYTGERAGKVKIVEKGVFRCEISEDP